MMSRAASLVSFAALAASLAFAAEPKPATIPIERFLGTWRGFSICSGPRAACKDERVRFYVTRATSGPYDVIQTAEKLVGASWDTMAVIEMNYDAAKGELYRDREMGTSRGVFRFRLAGDSLDRMEGTLVTLPDSVLGRVIEVSRDTARAPEREPDSVFAPVEWLVGGTWQFGKDVPGKSRRIAESYAWRNDRVAIHFTRDGRPGFIAYDPVARSLVEWSGNRVGDLNRQSIEDAGSDGYTTVDGTTRWILRRTGKDEFVKDTRTATPRDTVSFLSGPYSRTVP